jgi:2-aminoadipate transaminase
MKTPFAQRFAHITSSSLSYILKAPMQPDVISFAGGLPATELFPLEDLRAASERVLGARGQVALQYGSTIGYQPLRELLVGEMARRGVRCSTEQIILTSGSQQALDLLARSFLDPGDTVITESPTYLTAIRVFQSCEARFVLAPTDGEGIIPEALPELIERFRPKILYTIPNFQNPSGITLAEPRRKAIAQLAAQYGVLIVEDDPYGQLRYAGNDIPPVKAYDEANQIAYVSTFSKTVAPGLRVGWVVATPETVEKLVVMKQVADTMSSTLDQRMVYEYLRTGENAAHVERIRTAYRERYRVMDAALREYMPEGFSWTKPEGGMFLWVTGPEGLDAAELLRVALEHRVLFVPGQDFFPDGSGGRHFRLSFSNTVPERIREGIRILAALCHAQSAALASGSSR